MLGKMPPGCMEATHQPSKTVFRLHKTTVFRNGPGPSKVEKLILKAAPWELILVPTVAKLHKMMLKTCVDKCVDTCVDTVLTQKASLLQKGSSQGGPRGDPRGDPRGAPGKKIHKI